MCQAAWQPEHVAFNSGISTKRQRERERKRMGGSRVRPSQQSKTWTSLRDFVFVAFQFKLCKLQVDSLYENRANTISQITLFFGLHQNFICCHSKSKLCHEHMRCRDYIWFSKCLRWLACNYRPALVYFGLISILVMLSNTDECGYQLSQYLNFARTELIYVHEVILIMVWALAQIEGLLLNRIALE